MNEYRNDPPNPAFEEAPNHPTPPAFVLLAAVERALRGWLRGRDNALIEVVELDINDGSTIRRIPADEYDEWLANQELVRAHLREHKWGDFHDANDCDCDDCRRERGR